MSDTTPRRPVNQETRPDWNREPGIIITPGSNYANEMQKFEQFPSKYGQNPGNPYVYRPFPKMLYKAFRRNGSLVCNATPPDPSLFNSPGEYARAEAEASRFTRECQMIVNSPEELSRAMESGWRESPADAVAHVKSVDRETSTAAAHREYEDRNLSEAAKREIATARAAHDGHLAVVPEARLAKPARDAAREADYAKRAAKAKATRAAKKAGEQPPAA